MAVWNDLPLEVKELVVQAADVPPLFIASSLLLLKPDRETLRALALVNHELSRMAQAVIWKTLDIDEIYLDRMHRHGQLSPRVKSHIRELNIIPFDDDAEMTKADETACQTFICSLPRLESMSITFPEFEGPPVPVKLASLQTATLKQLRRLTLEGSEDAPIPSEGVVRVLKASSNLEELVLTNVEPSHKRSFSPKASALQLALQGLPKLRKLELDDVDLDGPFLSDGWSGPVSHLRLEPTPGDILPLHAVLGPLQAFADTLEVLEIQALGIHDGEPDSALPSFSLPRLHTLTLTLFERTLNLFSAFPASPLRSVTFSCIMDDMKPVHQGVLRAIKQHQSTLQLVRVQAPSEVRGSATLHKTIAKECKRMGIEYRNREEEQYDDLDALAAYM